MRSLIFIVVVMILAAQTVGAVPSAPVPAAATALGVVATVNGEDISYDDYMTTLETMIAPVAPARNLVQKTAGARALEELVVQRLVTQLAVKEGVPVTDEQVEKRVQWLKDQGTLQGLMQSRRMTPVEFRKDLRGQLAYINLALKYSDVTDAEIEDFYFKNKTKFNLPVRVKVGAVVAKDRVKIDAAHKKLVEGADFAAVVKEYSEDPITKRTAGELGWVWPNQQGVPGSVSNTAMGLPVGGVSGPIMVQGQWVVLKAFERKPPTPRPFEEVRESIRETLAVERATRKPELKNKIADFRQSSTIEIFVKRYSRDLAVAIQSDDTAK